MFRKICTPTPDNRRIDSVLAMATYVAIALFAASGCGLQRTPRPTHLQSADTHHAPDDGEWTTYWSARGVSPAPPKTFLDPPPTMPKILNLTAGAVDDATALRWVIADLRRGLGDK